MDPMLQVPGVLHSDGISLCNCCFTSELLVFFLYPAVSLRTKEQLGYRVDCGLRLTYRVLGFCLRVQSAEYSPAHLHDRMDAFLMQFRSTLVGTLNQFEVGSRGNIQQSWCIRTPLWLT